MKFGLNPTSLFWMGRDVVTSAVSGVTILPIELQNRHKKESKTNSRTLAFIHMKCFPPYAQRCGLSNCESHTILRMSITRVAHLCGFLQRWGVWTSAVTFFFRERRSCVHASQPGDARNSARTETVALEQLSDYALGEAGGVQIKPMGSSDHAAKKRICTSPSLPTFAKQESQRWPPPPARMVLRKGCYTDSIQTGIIISGCALMVLDGLHKVWRLARAHPQSSPGHAPCEAVHRSQLPFWGVILSAVYGGTFYWGVDQVNVQRVLGARNIDQARSGAMFTVFLKLLPVFILRCRE